MIQNASENKVNRRAGRWFLVLIGLSVMLLGMLFCWLLLQSYLNAVATRNWPQGEAVVLQSDIEQRQIQGSQVEYRLQVLYSYEYQNQHFLSDKISPRGAKWSRREQDVMDLAETYSQGSSHAVWINPESHDTAILEHDTKAAGYTLWFPVLFVIAGGGMIWSACRATGEE